MSTKLKPTDITIILDRSGSMVSTYQDAIGGFNSFVDEQKAGDGEAFLSLIQFDDKYELNYEQKPIKEVEHLTRATYVPRGSTALVDAIGKTLMTLKARIKAIPKAERPNVVVVIITDGQENASYEYKMVDVNAIITKLKSKGWEINFIGANQDAIKTGSSLGINAANSLTYAANSIGTTSVFRSMSKNIADYRSGLKSDLTFEDGDRLAQAVAGVKLQPDVTL